MIPQRPGGWRLPLLLAWRYIRGGRSTRLLHRTALAALASVALGVASMVVAMALLTGYREDLEAKLIAGNAAILAYPLGPLADDEPSRVSRLLELEEVTWVQRIAYGQGTLSSATVTGEAVTLRGAAPDRDSLAGPEADLEVDHQGVAGTVLGAELAAHLGAERDDLLRLVALGFEDGRPRFAYRTLRVTGTYRTGFAEFDRRWAVVDRALVETVSGSGTAGSLLEIAVRDPARAPEVAREVEAQLGASYLVTDWRQLNRELFAALELQQLGLFFLLGLIVVVSTFNVASTLMVLVRERMREVGVLTALGFEAQRVRATFMAYGLGLGAVGIGIGLGLGGGVSWLLSTFEVVRFDPEVAEIYFISAVPFRVVARDLAAVTGFAVAATFLSTVVPARRASRVRLDRALRYE